MATESDKRLHLLVIGGGNMGSAIVQGLLSKGWNFQQLAILELSSERTEKLQTKYPELRIIGSYTDLPDADNYLLAVKPGQIAEACRQLKDNTCTYSQTLFISIAAGITLSSLHKWLGRDAFIVRCMPNTPASIQLGMTVLYGVPGLNDALRSSADDILSSVGATLWVDEEAQLDAVTAVSGSGPAYFFYFMECLFNSGVQLGLKPQDCLQLVKQTALGACQLAYSSESSLADLRSQVTSKGGTTAQALASFQQNHLQTIVTDAVNAAALRATEISRELK